MLTSHLSSDFTHTHGASVVCVNSSELKVKASLDTSFSPGFETPPSVSLITGSRPAKGEQHANEYTRVHGHKSGKSHVLEGAQLFLGYDVECGEVTKNDWASKWSGWINKYNN